MTSSSAASSSHLHITITNPTSAITTATNGTKPHIYRLHSGARSHSNSVSPRGGGGGGGSGGGTTNQACAACKYQRRKCNPDCPLAPYFPADQQRRFLHAHRLFGVSNILKTLRRLKPELCDAAMQTLIYEAEMRHMDPAGGCCRIITELEQTCTLESAELAALQHHLGLYRQATPCVGALPTGGGGTDGTCADLEVTSSNHQSLLLGADQDQVVVDALYVGQEADAVIRNGADQDDLNNSPQPQDHHGGQQQQQLYDYFYYETTGASGGAGIEPLGSASPLTGAGEDAGSKPGGVDINVDVMEHFDYDSGCDVDDGHQKLDQLGPMMSSGLGQQLEEHYQIDHKEYEMKVASLVDVFDMRQELQAVDVNANIGVKEELQEEEDDKNNIKLSEAAHMAESSHCRLGLGF